MEKGTQSTTEEIENPKQPISSPTNTVATLGAPVTVQMVLQWVRGVVDRFFRTGEGPDPDLYVWRTQEDGKVRESHRYNDGTLFRKSAPPPTGNPGEDYNCRCWAEHVVPRGIQIRES